MRKLTTIALFVVLAALLMAAVTPNFTNLQIRQRLARAHADMAVIAGALEAYKVDHGKYPFDGGSGSLPNWWYWYLGYNMTTPVAYLKEIPADPFKEDLSLPGTVYYTYRYTNTRSTWGTDYYRTSPSIYLDILLGYWGEYRILCVGPDEHVGPLGWYPESGYPQLCFPYDPTNGLNSVGDIELGSRIPPYLE